MEETPLISKELLKLLVCPVTGLRLELENDKLVCKQTSVSYPICDGIPILIPNNSDQLLYQK